MYSPDLKYLADRLVNQLVTTNDPRLSGLVQSTVNSVKVGKPAYKGIGVALTDALLKTIIKDDYSTASQATFSNKAYTPPIPCVQMTYADVSIDKAEAALESWGAITDQAEKFCQDGIKAAMSMAPYNVTTIPVTYTELSFTGLTKEQKLEKLGRRNGFSYLAGRTKPLLSGVGWAALN